MSAAGSAGQRSDRKWLLSPAPLSFQADCHWLGVVAAATPPGESSIRVGQPVYKLSVDFQLTNLPSAVLCWLAFQPCILTSAGLPLAAGAATSEFRKANEVGTGWLASP